MSYVSAGGTRPRRPTLIGFALVYLLASACLDPGAVAEIKANETKAMSLLRGWVTAQALFQVEGIEGGRYRTLEELSRSGGLLSEELANAWDGGRTAQPVSGYLFSEIRSDRHRRVGLCAYPERPGRSGNLIVLLLIHSSNPKDWAYYVAPFRDIGKPITRWPSKAKLSDFIQVRPGTPKQGMQKVRETLERSIESRPN